MTPPGPNSVCGDTKTSLKIDFYHFLWNFTCHFVNKAYAKKRKNIFFLHMHFKNYRVKRELTFTPSCRKEKHITKNMTRIVVGFVGKTQSIVVGFVVKMQSIVVEFVVKAQRIVVECLRLDSDAWVDWPKSVFMTENLLAFLIDRSKRL